MKKPGHVELTSYEFDTLVLYAVRYTLGRRTYAPHEMCALIKSHIGDLKKGTLERILKEISEAVSLGDDCDKTEWLHTAAKIESVLKGM